MLSVATSKGKQEVTKDPQEEAFDIIHDIAAHLLLREDLAPETTIDLEIILTLARNRANVLGLQDKERLIAIRGST
jgi:hypothetical protein